LPDGRAVMWSLLQLVSKKTDELVSPGAIEEYYAVGQQLGCFPLGMLPDDQPRA
jgi:hypothetical protein